MTAIDQRRAGFLLRIVLLLCSACELAALTTVSHVSPSSGYGAHRVLSSKGIAAGGILQLSYDMTLVHDAPTPSFPVYIYLLSMAQSDDWFYRVKDPSAAVLCGTPSVAREQIIMSGRPGTSTSGNLTFILRETDRYSAFVAVCVSEDDNLPPLQGTIQISFVSPDSTGKLAQRLPVEDAPLPLIFMVLSAIYAMILWMWLEECFRARAFVHAAHMSCAATVAFRLLSCATLASYFRGLNKTGVDNFDGFKTIAAISTACGEVSLLVSLTIMCVKSRARIFFS